MLVKQVGLWRKRGPSVTIPVFCRTCGKPVKVPRVKHGDRTRGSGNVPDQPTSGLALCGKCLRK